MTIIKFIAAAVLAGIITIMARDAKRYIHMQITLFIAERKVKKIMKQEKLKFAKELEEIRKQK